MKPVAIVPYRATTARREQNWGRALKQWEDGGFDVRLGDSPGEWNTAEARNLAAASDWDAAIFCDADIVLESIGQAYVALAAAVKTGSYVACYDRFCWLDDNDKVMREAGGIWICAFAIRRDLWDAIGGMDESLGVSGEDVRFIEEANRLGGPKGRAPGRAFHLWHPRSRP